MVYSLIFNKFSGQDARTNAWANTVIVVYVIIMIYYTGIFIAIIKGTFCRYLYSYTPYFQMRMHLIIC